MEAKTTNSIQIVVNGQVRAVPAGMTLSETLALLEVDPARIAVELNRVIVHRAAWNDMRVDAGATLEIVQFVGGG